MIHTGALIYQISDDRIYQVEYQETEHYEVTKAFLTNPERMLRELFQDDQMIESADTFSTQQHG